MSGGIFVFLWVNFYTSSTRKWVFSPEKSTLCVCVCVKTRVYVTELSTWACFNAGLAFKSEIFLKCRYSYGKQAKASTKKLTIRLSGITWAGKSLAASGLVEERISWASYDALSSNTNVLSKSSCNTKCSVSVLCCCKDKIPLLQRLKSQDRSPSTCLLATTKINIFCSFELLCILHSVTWDSHKAVMWYVWILWAVSEAKS